MEELKIRLLEKLKNQKGIVDEKLDDVFLFALETAIFDVLDYCNITIDNWQDALDNKTILMAVDIINETNFTFNATEDEGGGEMKSLSEGDFSISRETKAEAYQKMMELPSFSRNYTRTLNKYRKMR